MSETSIPVPSPQEVEISPQPLSGTPGRLWPESISTDTSVPNTPDGSQAAPAPKLSAPAEQSQSDLDGKAAADAIATLWTERQQCQAALKTAREALAENRLALQEALYGYKERLCRTGRNSEWAGLLRSMRIPPSTADRYVAAWKKRLADSAGVMPEALEPTDEDIAKLTRKVARLIEAVVTSPTNMKRFSNSCVRLCRLRTPG